MAGETYEVLNLIETPEGIFIQSVGGANDEFIAINRDTQQITVSRDLKQIPVDAGGGRRICGLIGLIQLIAGPYLIIAKSRVRVGEIGKHVIWQLGQYELLPICRSLFHLNEKQVAFNQSYLDMLGTVLNTPYFYYSHTYDLSHNLQSLNYNSPDFYKSSLLERSDEKFVWNKFLLQPFEGEQFRRFCLPLIHGFIEIVNVAVNGHEFKLSLISRRSCKRAGTRLFCRGIDQEGNVANFVETEQIIEFNGEMASFVQIRGSVPLYWTQKPNLKYKPPPTLLQANHSEAFERHFQDLIMRYHRIVCVNLVNQSGSELVLHETFAKQVAASSVPNIRYEGFDFHHECRNMRWDRLDILTNRLSQELEDFGYHLLSRGQIQKTQEGVFRTNCVDCLDRTNVVQGLLAKLNLEVVLRIMRDGEKISSHPDLEYFLKNRWADNGDVCSMEYAGTGALKSDFTRTGKRTLFGLLRDGYNSGIRYFKNNFIDGHRQDGMDLFLGNFSPRPGEGLTLKSPLDKDRDWKYFTLPALFLFSFLMFMSLVWWPGGAGGEYTTEFLLYILFWGSMFFTTSTLIIYYGTEFVDSPVLMETHRLTM